jgi:predicted dehydrogenase
MDERSKNISRREFFSKGSKFAAGAAVASGLSSSSRAEVPRSENGKTRVVLVGTGNRGTSTWGSNLVGPYSDIVEMVGLCDINRKRVEVGKELIGVDCPTYHSSQFDQMIEETDPDMVIVTTTDSFHAKYVVRAMELGCDALSEKPLATEAEQCQRILETEEETGQTVHVGFNARHGRSTEEVKRVLNSGRLGRIISAEFDEYLDTSHGASYFRRWHGKNRFSGSLLCHKASHHFDQINWWLDAEPVEVNAFGKVDFYGSNNGFRSEKCRGCDFQDQCDFYWDITESSERYQRLYVDCEDVDGYYRDGCVWDNDIDAYDTMTVEVKYNNGVLLAYTLNAYMPYEGQRIAFNGTKGRLDVQNFHRQSWEVPYEAEFRLSESFGASERWLVGEEGEVDTGEGGHGGADASLKDLIFRPETPDPMNQYAGSRAGVMSSLIGIAARQSIETGKRVKIDEIIDFPNQWQWSG